MLQNPEAINDFKDYLIQSMNEDVDELTDLILQGIDKIVEDYYEEDDEDESDD